MKEQLLALWGKVVENKDVVIRVGGAAVGAAVGLAIAAIVVNAQEDSLLEEVVMQIEEE